MISKIYVSAVLVVSFLVVPAYAADVFEKYRIDDAMNIPKVSSQLSGDIEFYWGDQPHPPIAQTYGTFKTSKRTSALGKSRGHACAWAMASALSALRDRAYREGGNAVINIVSNIKNRQESSAVNYSCLAGSVVVNVALKGTVVTLTN